MSNHQSSSNTPSQLSLLCKTFKSPELQQAEVNLIMITCRHLPYLDSVSLIFFHDISIGHPKEDDYNLISIVQQITEHFEVSHFSRWDHSLENRTGLSVNKQSEEHNLQTVSGSTACKKKTGATVKICNSVLHEGGINISRDCSNHLKIYGLKKSRVGLIFYRAGE